VHELVDDAPSRALELAEEIACLPPMSVANAKRALYLGADANLQAAFEIENMAWTEVLQSDDAQLALKTFIAVDPDSRRDWFRVRRIGRTTLTLATGSFTDALRPSARQYLGER